METNTLIKNIEPLSLPWKSQDPFIFCSYHLDKYPGGNDAMQPKSGLNGRNIGQDFSAKDGWSMYHGQKVPGFPAHPHCGFETVTVVTQGMTDHSDSLGGHGRFGEGDVQWLTAGKGVQHSEMFPLLKEDANPFEIFQLWLNLPAKDKKVEPYYKMLWKEDIPVVKKKDKNGKSTEVNLVAGYLDKQIALSPNPDSWAADPNNHVQIWTIKMEAGAYFNIPPVDANVNRTLYFYEGDTVNIGETKIAKGNLIELNNSQNISLVNGQKEGYFLFLQGCPIGEPIVQYGPFLAESEQALRQNIAEYQNTRYGGWPWSSAEPVHDKTSGRFSVTPDGKKVVK